MIIISPHNDDEALFVAYTIMREKPRVIIVTDSFIQEPRTGVNWQQRRQESVEALKLVGITPEFLGIPDDKITHETLKIALQAMQTDELVLCPALQGGHKHHDLVNEVCKEVYPNLKFYTAYTKEDLYTEGEIEVKPTEDEMKLKNNMLECYRSQLYHDWTRPHFIAVINRSEWINTK